MRPSSRGIRWSPRSALGVLLAAGLVHIAVILLLSGGHGRDAYRRIATLGANAPLTTFAGPADTDKLLPYRDPAMATAFCLFDLAQGPVRVSLPVNALDFAAVSIHGSDGRVRYGLTNETAANGSITLSLALRTQGGAEETSGGTPRVWLAEPRGFAAVQVLSDMPGQRREAEEAARRLNCRPDKSSE